MQIFPNNTLAEFTVNLETPLELSSDYEVGLCELQYPQSWDNIRRGSNAFHIAYQLPRGREFTDKREVPPGYYEKIPDVISAIKMPIALLVGRICRCRAWRWRLIQQRVGLVSIQAQCNL